MSTYKVNVSNEALYDLMSIYNYIAVELQETTYAERQIKRIRNTIGSLDEFPLRNKVVEWDPWSSLGIRQMPIDNFITYYFTDEEQHKVTILRIFYGKRDIEKVVKEGF